jgi:anti-anti-sigma factor
LIVGDTVGPNATASFGTAFSADKSLACVRLAGDLDSNSWHLLADLQARLALAAPTRILIDLESTTFAGVSLMAFFARLATDSSRSVILCRPTDQTAGVIVMTDVFQVVNVSDDLPPEWIDPMAHELTRQ